MSKRDALRCARYTMNHMICILMASIVYLTQLDSSHLFAPGLEDHSRLKRIRLDTIASMQSNAEASSSYIQSALASTSQEIESFVDSVLTNVSNASKLSLVHANLFSIRSRNSRI